MKYQIYKKLRYLILSVSLAVITYPVLCVFLIPLLAYRYVVKKLVQHREPKIGAMLTGVDAFMAGSEPYAKPVVVLAPYYPFKQKIEREQIIKVLEEQVIKPNYFPNLKQRIVQRYGYHFWHEIDNFSVENHVRYMNPDDIEKPVTRGEMRLWCAEECKKPFDSGRSPWEWILIPNFIDLEDSNVKSMAILRVSHCLMDGYSFHIFGSKLSLKPWKAPGENIIGKKAKSFKEKMVELVQLAVIAITAPYHTLEILVNDRNEVLQNGISKSLKENRVKWIGRAEELPQVPIERFKQVKKLHGVSVSTVIIALVSMATAKCISKQFGKIPKRMYIMLSYPMPGHPEALTNHWCSVKIPVRVHENDPVRTLHGIKREYEKAIHSPAPAVSFYIGQLTGVLPVPWIPKAKDLGAQTMILVNFPGPLSKEADLFGYDYDDFSFVGNAASGTGFVYNSVSMGGKFRFTAGVLETLVKSQEDAEELADFLMHSLKELENEDNNCNDTSNEKLKSS